MEIESGVNSGNIKSLKKVFESWHEILEIYIRTSGYEDCPWWYNERATLSSLSAAIWKSNGIALEEYCTEKGKKDDEYSGRCDMYFYKGSNGFACESKQVWCAIGRRAKIGLKKIESSINIACKDARNLNKNEGRRLGICFAVPYLPPSDKPYIETRLGKWINQIQTLDYSSISWFFPSKTRYLENENGYFYPGVAVFVKEVFQQ